MKVLVVDDDQYIQRMYGRTMQLESVEVIGINEGTQAVETAKREKPDIILMDVMMPKMNGLDALRALKASDETKDIPVIMLSAYEEEALLLNAINSGASMYLLKSDFEPQQIVDILKETVESIKKPDQQK